MDSWRKITHEALKIEEQSPNLGTFNTDLLLGYPTSVVKRVGDKFISVRESLIS